MQSDPTGVTMNRQIADCWEIILRADPALRNHPLRPLDHLEPSLRECGLSPLEHDGEERSDAAPPVEATPSFKALTDDILRSLRLHLGDADMLPTIDLWAEKLLRFVELRRRSLRSRALQKCGSPAAARLHVLHLACFLMDYAAFCHDIRFLNTALKLADMSWVLRRSTLSKHLQAQDERFVEALFQFRLLLMTDWALARLQREGAG